MLGRKAIFPHDGLRVNMTWKMELAALAITAASIGGYLYKTDPFKEAAVTYHAKFTEADFNAFQRDFELSGDMCDVGLQAYNICLSDFEVKQHIVPGERFPENLPALGAGMRLLLAMDAKEQHLQTVQYGQTLVLIERSKKQVEDVLYLNAPTYADARTPKLRGSPVTMAAN